MDLSRRQFFKLRLSSSVKLAMDSSEQEELSPIRPPGALTDDSTFLSACTGCGKCVSACPFEAIQTFGPEAGPHESTPYIDLIENPCRWCEDFLCIEACGDEALLLSNILPIAKAQINLSDCLNLQGILCDSCVSVCPSSIHAISMKDHRPILDPEKCVGCGLCAWHCQAEPLAIEFVPNSESISLGNS